MPVHRSRPRCWGILLAAGVLLLGGSAAAADQAAAGTLVFVTQSDACDCVVNLCVAGEQEVINFLGDAGAGLAYQRVDLTPEPDAARTYRAVTLPLALLLDPAGGEVGRFASFFTEDQLAATWRAYRKEAGQ
jgi:hypothetical protein